MGEALTAASVAKAYRGRAARSVCETAIQVHGGIGNTWECLAHVFLRRALVSTPSCSEGSATLGASARRRGDRWRWTSLMLPKNASSGSACVAGWRRTRRALPPSSTADEYWAGQAAWHQSLYDAGFFGLTWPREVGGHGLPSVYDVILDEELIAAGAPPRPSVGYLVQGILRHGSADVQRRFLPGLVSGRDRWCQGFSEPDADRTSRRCGPRRSARGPSTSSPATRCGPATRTPAQWCLVLARTDPDVPKHRGISAFAVPMDQPEIEQRPLRMINGITREFGEVLFDGARVDEANMIGRPGEGWALAMTVVSHEREPGELGYVARYGKLVKELAATVRERPAVVRPRAAPGAGLGSRRDRDAARSRVPALVRAPRRDHARAPGLGGQAAHDLH